MKYLFNYFKSFLKKRFSIHQNLKKSIPGLLLVGDHINIENLSLECRNPIKDKIYMTIHEHSIISGNFVFETMTGYIQIGSRSFVGGGLFICIEGIEIGDDVLISWGCTFIDNNAHSTSWRHRQKDVIDWKRGIDEFQLGKYKDWSNIKKAKIVIKNKAWIGFNSIILKGVTIGEGTIVGAGSVVTHDLPDWCIAAGNPAKIVKYLSPDER